MSIRICTACRVEKPLTEFHRKRKDSDVRMAMCGPCRTARRRKNIQSGKWKRYDDWGKIVVVANTVLGACCVLCGSTRRLVMHQQDGLPHLPVQRIARSKVAGFLRDGRFVRLCQPCHNGVHWAMRHLAYTWLHILKRVRSSSGRTLPRQGRGVQFESARIHRA